MVQKPPPLGVGSVTEIAWDDLIQAVSDGQIDMGADSITRLSEKYELVDFSMPFVTFRQVLIVRVNDNRFSTMAEFFASDAKIWAFEGSTNYDAAVALVGSPRVESTLSDVSDLVLQLIESQIDAIALDSVTAQKVLAENSDAIMAFSDSLTEAEELAFIFPNGSELTSAFNIAIEVMRLDGSLVELNHKWFAGD